LVLLNCGSRKDERDPSILYNFSGQFAHKLHYFKLGHLPREVTFENTKYNHQNGGIPNIGITLVLLNRGSRTVERDLYILYKLSGQFAHKLHYFQVGHLPRSGIRKKQNITTKMIAFQT
jgi:hypothetical protein